MTGVKPHPLRFRRRHRLTRASEFQAAYRTGLRRSAGPITLYLRPNGLPEHRLGLSVGRRVGPAVVRNRLKRLLREAFRHERPALPTAPDGAFDFVLTARPHKPLPLTRYRAILADLARRAAADLARRKPTP